MKDPSIAEHPKIDDAAPKNLGMVDHETLAEQHKRICFEKVEQIYGFDSYTQDEARKYKQMIEQAAMTSEEAAGLLGWENEDIENTIKAFPESPETYKEKVGRIEKLMQKNALDHQNGLEKI